LVAGSDLNGRLSGYEFEGHTLSLDDLIDLTVLQILLMLNTLIHLVAAKQEKFRPTHECFFLTSPLIEQIRWDEKAGLRGMRYAPNVRRARGTMKRRPAMKKTSTVRVNGNMIFKGHKLTIGLDLGDH
jgi:hypothetical protein